MLTRWVGTITDMIVTVHVGGLLQAIEFAMEEGDEDLWELLISLSIGKPSMYCWTLQVVLLILFRSVLMKVPFRVQHQKISLVTSGDYLTIHHLQANFILTRGY